MTTSPRTWLITGASRGFGRQWTQAALERGERVVATVRSTSALDDLAAAYPDTLWVRALDVTDRAGAIRVVDEAVSLMGSLDVVVNNAGYGQFGFLEELSEADVRDQFDTNVHGLLWITQAALPHMRRQGSGHIIQVSSVGGLMASPWLGIYNASKWAVEGLSQSLAAEVAPFGIAVTLVEPAGFSTDWAGASARIAEPLADYDEVRAGVLAAREKQVAGRGNPEATAEAILRIVDAAEPPLRVLFGAGTVDRMAGLYEERVAAWKAWEPVSELAHG